MIVENVIRFITEANTAGINSVNRALAEQAQRIRELASAQRYVQNATGSRFRDPTSGQFINQAELERQLQQATTFSARLTDTFRQARQKIVAAFNIPNLLNNLIRGFNNVPAAMNSLVQGVNSGIAQIKVTFQGLARAITDILGAAIRGLAALIVSGLTKAAQSAAAAIKNVIGGALNAVKNAAVGAVNAVRNLASRLKGLAAGAGILGALGVALGVKEAAQVQQALAVINTIAQTTDETLDRVAAGLLEISANTGTTIDDLSQAFYDLLSAGIAVEDVMKGNVKPALDLMQAAAYLAVGGLGTVEQSLDFLTSVLNSFRGALTTEFGEPILGATAIVDAFSKSIEIGKVVASEIAATISIVAPLAAQLGLDFREVAAVLAVMTQQGFSAGEAFTALRSALVGVQRNSKALQKALTDPIVKSELAKVGAKGWLEYLDVAGFQQFASVLRDYSERAGVPLIKLLGRIEGVQAILGTTGPQAEVYADALAQITDSEGTAARQAEAFNDSLFAQIRLLKNAFIGLADTLFRRRIVEPLTELTKQFRLFIIELNRFLQTPVAKALLDILVPVGSLLLLMAALTAGASAVESVFIRLGGPVSGFGFGIAGVARAIALLIGPLGVAALLFGALTQGLERGILPAEQFQPILSNIITSFRSIITFGRTVGEVLDRVVRAISEGRSVRLEGIFSFGATEIQKALDDITFNVRAVIQSIRNAIFGGSEWKTASERGAITIANALYDAVASAVEYVLPRIADVLIQLFQFTGEAYVNAVEFGANLVSGIAQGISDTLPRIADAIADIPDQVQAGGAKALTGVFAFLALIIGGWPRLFLLVLAAATSGMLREWLGSIQDWFARNGPKLLAGLGDIIESVAEVLGRVIPGLVEETFAIVAEFAPQVADAIGTAVAALGQFVIGAIPVLADAAHVLLDWIAQAIPQVAGAVARFIDEVVRNLVPLGQDGGPVDSAMGDAAAALVGWIADTIPDVIAQLVDWGLEVENWIITVLAPRILAAGLYLAGKLLEGLANGLIYVVTNPVDAINGVVKVVTLILTAGAIIAAAQAAGAAVGAAFRLAFGAAAFTAGAITAGLKAALPAALTAATGAGSAIGLAIVGGITAAIAAVPIAVALVIQTGLDEQERGISDSITNLIETGTAEGLLQAKRSLEEGIRQLQASTVFRPLPVTIVDSILGVFGGGTSGSINELTADLERVKAALADLGYVTESETDRMYTALEDNRANFRNAAEAAGEALKEPIVTKMEETVTAFKEGTQAIVDDFNSTPDKLKTGAERLKEALANPFNLDDVLTQFEEGYKLILEAQSSGNVSAIVESNVLKQTMIQQAEAINAAFVAAGQAPPLLINAITGEITPAGTAATSLADSVTTPIDDMSDALSRAGEPASEIPADILKQVGPAGTAAAALGAAATRPLATIASRAGTWGSNIGRTWLNNLTAYLRKYGPNAVMQAAEAALKGIRGFSPPKEGPLRNIDVWGANVAKSWIDGFVTSMQSEASRVGEAVSTATSLIPSTLEGPTVSMAYATADGPTPALADTARGLGPTQAATLDGDRMEQLLERVVTQLDLGNQLAARNRGERSSGEARSTLAQLSVMSRGA